jgi:HSP20 family protein
MVPSGDAKARQIARNNSQYLSENLERMFEDFRSSFNQMMTPFVAPSIYLDPEPTYSAAVAAPLTQALTGTLDESRYPILDIVDEEDHYSVTAELPGFNKENVEIQVGEDMLQLSAQVRSEQKTTSSSGKKYVNRERGYSSFQRVVQFPEQIVASKAEGAMKDGVLQLKLPKKQPAATRFVKIALK